MESIASNTLLELNCSPVKNKAANQINSWNQTHDKKNLFRITPVTKTRNKHVPSNVIQELKVRKDKLVNMNTPSPCKEHPSNNLNQHRSVNLSLQPKSKESKELKLPPMSQRSHEYSFQNKQNINIQQWLLPPSSQRGQYTKNAYPKKNHCRLSLIPCKSSTSTEVVQKNLKQRINEMGNPRILIKQEDYLQHYIRKIPRIV